MWCALTKTNNLNRCGVTYACLLGILGDRLLHNMPLVVFRLLQDKCFGRGNCILEIGA